MKAEKQTINKIHAYQASPSSPRTRFAEQMHAAVLPSYHHLAARYTQCTFRQPVSAQQSKMPSILYSMHRGDRSELDVANSAIWYGAPHTITVSLVSNELISA